MVYLFLENMHNLFMRRTVFLDKECIFSALIDCTQKETALALIGKSGFYGAGDEARTRYLHLGKVALYRMSYARTEQSLL